MSAGGKPKDETSTKPAVPPESDREQKRNLAYLVVLAGVSAGEMFKLQEETDRGRPRAEGRRSGSTTRASRASTASFVRDGDKMVVEDMGSTNGTFCNGIRIDRRELTDGDKIMVGLDDDPEVHLPRLPGRGVPAPDVRVGAARRPDQGLQQEVLHRLPGEGVRVRRRGTAGRWR